ncbi:hypothetical protein GCM10009836_04710 [Pseudonocardia ailaonensis]|uniref:DUF8017 domain-containing protein n=1 Tax=Pseudonocardia ailaonensis TaxID=367279 RepID=A0ABN2MJT3_9PSEU
MSGPEPPEPTDPDLPRWPGQRYPAVPGRPGEPPLPSPADPLPPGHPWAPAPPAPPAPPRARRRIAPAVAAVVVLVLAALGGGAYLIADTFGPRVPAGFRTVGEPWIGYAVPGDWTAVPGDGPRTLGVTFSGGATGPSYECRGGHYVRGVVSSALVRTSADPSVTARRFANGFGRSFYTGLGGQLPRLQTGAPQQVRIGEVTAVLVEVTSTATADAGCLAGSGTTFVLAVPVAGGTAVLVANADREGGPDTPALTSHEALRAVVDSVTLPDR